MVGPKFNVMNGYLPERSITTGIGPVKIRQPRVHDRRANDEAEPFSSKICRLIASVVTGEIDVQNRRYRAQQEPLKPTAACPM